MELVDVAPLDPANFGSVLNEADLRDFLAMAEHAQELLDGRTLWNINSTAQGGGVAEMLASLLAYTRGAGIDSRWLVLPGEPDFFAITKRIHNRLHGHAGDGGPLGDHERQVYERVARQSTETLLGHVKAGDVVLVHDPQPAPLIEPLKDAGAHVVWRLHVGADNPNGIVHETWDFLRPYVAPADRWVFSRDSFVWEGLDRERVSIIAPSIDIFSPKNQDLHESSVHAILVAAGLVDDSTSASPEYRREDGSIGCVESRADLVQERALTLDHPYALQVSRWDALKDHGGVMRAFAEHVAPHTDAALVLAGPSTEGVADDPEGAQELERIKQAWAELPDGVRARVHIASLPMNDRQENAAIVNALQRHAAVVVQKSLAEGFGLTVSEGMWKSRPLVAGAVGGIQDQVIAGETGWLVEPHDLADTGRRMLELLRDPQTADRMGRAGRDRVLECFTAIRHLNEWADVVEAL